MAHIRSVPRQQADPLSKSQLRRLLTTMCVAFSPRMYSVSSRGTKIGYSSLEGAEQS